VSARDDYPLLRVAEKANQCCLAYEFEDASQITAALDEIDRLRADLAKWRTDDPAEIRRRMEQAYRKLQLERWPSLGRDD